MTNILGIGGFFFRSKDPDALARWYEDHFGISRVPDSYDEPGWRQGGGITVFSPFKDDTDYFGDPTKQWMINFRVRDLDQTIAALEKAGIEVERNSEDYPNGRFASLTDPEGNPIELWEPSGQSLDLEEKT